MMVVISYQIRVLIDTWWNVNDATPKTLDDIYKVLIDTWWNVNYSVESVFASGLFSFNRYMVECEYRQKIHKFQPYRVLIDTWWNVNQI